MVLHGVVKSVRILKMSTRKTKLRRPFVHHFNERRLSSRHVLGKSQSRVVCGGYHHAFHQILNAHLLALFKIYLRAAHRTGVSACGHGIGKGYFPAVYRLHNEKQSHHLGYRRRRQRFVRVHLVKHLARFRLHKYGRPAIERKFVILRPLLRFCVCRRRKGAEQNSRRKYNCHKLL